MTAAMIRVGCPYCGGLATLFRSSAQFYGGHDYGPLWACVACQAWVGCHKGTETPLGRLADKDLRQAKRRAHAAFDPLWRTGMMSRGSAYAFLATQLDIGRSVCHIGYFDIATCERVVQICSGLAERGPERGPEGVPWPPASVERHNRRQRSL
jgi:hypothetical protein